MVPPPRTLRDYLVPQPQPERPGPTIEAQKKRISAIEDTRELGLPQPRQAMTSEELENMIMDVATPMGLAGSVRKVGAKAASELGSELANRIPSLWHGTAADPFAKFLREKLGSGGAGGNRMGVAAYLSGARQEATKYLEELLAAAGKKSELVTREGNISLPADMATRLRSGEMTLDEAIRGQQEQLASLSATKPKSKAMGATMREQQMTAQERLQDLLTARDRGVTGVNRPGALYEVGVDAPADRLLQFDKDLIDQPPFVQGAIKDLLGIQNINPNNPEQLMGFNRLLRTLPTPAVTRRVENTGIVGVQGASPRGFIDDAGRRVQNYAIFDPDRISIMRTLGMAGLLGGGAAASRPSGEQPLAPSNRMR